jgi:predicted Rossmann fold flavoprotein
MEQAKNNYDVAVIGAGPAGMMAAISAAENGAKVVLIEKNDSAGKKLLLTGGGRCNITNLEPDLRKFVANYGKSGSFLFHAFAEFGPKTTMDFFNAAGVETVIENNQRVLAKSGKAEDVLKVLVNRLEKLGVEIIYGRKVIAIDKDGGLISSVVIDGGDTVFARNYVMATGGKSYPGTGSTGDGYDWAYALGHRIVKLAPALVPVKTKEPWINDLAGTGLRRAGITVFQNQRKTISAAGEVLFTHFGLSGPAILNISVGIGELLQAGEVVISLNLMPELTRDELAAAILENFQKNPNKILKNCLNDFIPSGLSLAVAQLADINPAKTVNNVTKEERLRLADTTRDLRLTVSGLLEIETGMVTSGGVALEEIDDKTMRSKIVFNLFFAGEIINVHGATGGFNLQQCWSTGRLAGIKASLAKASHFSGASASGNLQIGKTE